MVLRINPKHRFVYGGVNIYICHADKGEGLPLHQHIYDHAIMCHAGSCKVTQENKSVIIDKNSIPIDIIANKPHEIEALEDGTIFVNIFKDGEQGV
jgi:hypothetical protein